MLYNILFIYSYIVQITNFATFNLNPCNVQLKPIQSEDNCYNK